MENIRRSFFYSQQDSMSDLEFSRSWNDGHDCKRIRIKNKPIKATGKDSFKESKKK